MNFREQNRRTWDERARQRQQFATPASTEDLRDPMPLIDQCGWLGGDVRGRRVLCLAAGGGRQGPLFAAAGAVVTVVDLSPQMLALDREMMTQHRLTLRLVEASMDDLAPLADAGFEVVIQPVSTCYVPDIAAVYREVARVTVAGGLYISQHKQPVSLQADAQPSAGGYGLREPYHRRGPLPPVEGSVHREPGAAEFLHPWEELLGGLCRSGFVIQDLVEPRHANPAAAPGSFEHRSVYAPPYVTVKARRNGGSTGKLWTP